jgi:hypothetical protein
MGDGYPDVPADRLAAEGWERRTRSEETVFRTPTNTVVGRTVLYDDSVLQRALDEAGAGDLLGGGAGSGDRLVDTGDGDGYWRFFFATSLSFRPPLAPWVGPASMRPTVQREARSSFVEDLEARGFEGVERAGRQRIRTDAGNRARLTKVTATYPLADAPAETLDIEGWLAVWVERGSFRIAGGAYPVAGLTALLADLPDEDRPATDPGQFRDDLVDLIRAVE